MKIDRVKLSRVKGRNQIIISFNKELIIDSNFNEGDYVTMICDKNKIVLTKGDQIKINV